MNAIIAEQLNKTFKTFSLKDVSFTVPQGSIVGLVGENGSGKSTIMRCLLNQDIPDSGRIELLGQNAQTCVAVHNEIGVSYDQCPFPENFTAKDINTVLKNAYKNWDEEQFFSLLKRFHLPENQKLSKMSKGMKVKMTISTCLSHQARLLLLDEATAGLDPIVREEILDMLQEFMDKEDHAIFMTTHITSDLEKIADYILFIQDGRILFQESRIQMEQYGLARLRAEEMEFIDPDLVLRTRQQPTHIELLIKDRTAFRHRYPDYVIEPASIDDVILMLTKGDK